MDLSHFQYRGGCAVYSYQTAHGVVGGCIYVGKMILYRQYNPDFIIL